MRTKLPVVMILFLVPVGAQATLAQARVQAPDEPADTRIPRNSKVYIVPNDGFEQYLGAALRKKSVPLLIVTDHSVADFEISITHEKQDANWARI